MGARSQLTVGESSRQRDTREMEGGKTLLISILFTILS